VRDPDTLGEIPSMDRGVEEHLGEVGLCRDFARRGVDRHIRLGRAHPVDRGFLGGGPCSRRIIAEPVALVAVAHLLEGRAPHEIGHPQRFVDEVVEQRTHVPLGARGGVRPLARPDAPDVTIGLLERRHVPFVHVVHGLLSFSIR
jgi:hypothetical protein